MEIAQKLEILKRIDTRGLIQKLLECEVALETAMREEAGFKAENRDYLGSGDCQEVKRILGELAVLAPEKTDAGKKMTIADREAWLLRQRTENQELSDAIAKQHQVSFLVADNQIQVEMARARHAGIRSVLALKTQQIAFLASG